VCAIDCLPVHDLVGGSDGFRRPGYILSAEPGITYEFKNIALYAYVPIAIIRYRTQSVPDIRQTEMTGVYAHGDAAFADYVVNVGITVSFGGVGHSKGNKDQNVEQIHVTQP